MTRAGEAAGRSGAALKILRATGIDLKHKQAHIHDDDDGLVVERGAEERAAAAAAAAASGRLRERRRVR